MSQRIRTALGLLLVLCLFSIAHVLKAQTAVDGAVGGTVVDASGAVVSGATVVVHSNNTNAEQTATTDGSGYFRVVHLQPGPYTVTVTATGFETFKGADITVQVGVLTAIDAKLNTGATTQTVEVTGSAPLVNTDSPSFAGVIEQHTLSNLPQNNYRWSAYALLTPGVVNDTNGFGLLSFRGQSTLLNNVTIDGTDDNQAFFSEERGRTRAGYSTAKASVQEFQVNTSNYSVEYGRSAGGIVNSVTKSGSNQFHGEGYFFDRDSDWNGINSSVTHAVPPTYQVVAFKPTDLRRQYGLGVGGPIWKDKIFFFLAADRFYHDFPGVATPIGTSANNNFYTPADTALPAGKTCGVTTGTAAPNYQDANVCQIAKNTGLTYAAASGVYTSGIQGLTTMLGTAPRDGDQTIYFPKIDWQVNSKNHVSIEANRMRWTSPAGIQTAPAVAYGTSSFGNDYVRDNWIVGKLDSFFASNLNNEVRYMYGRDFEFETNQSPTPYETANILNTAAGYANPLGLPTNVYLSGFFQFGTPQFLLRGAYPDERRWQLADTFEWIHGNHDLKFGEDYVHTYDLLSNLYNQFGGYSYSGNQTLGNYISDLYLSQQGATAQHYSSFNQGGGLPGTQFTTSDYAAFVQDQWKVNRRLSLSLGVRWDYEQYPDPQFPNPLLPQTATFNKNAGNISPRVGFAWDARGDGKTIVRGGYGIFYARAINSMLYQAIIGTGSAAGSQTNPSVFPGEAGVLPGCLPTFPQVVAANCLGASGGQSTAYFLDPNFRTPQIHQGDLTVEQQLSSSDVFSISWLGSWGRRLPDFVDTNLPAPTAVTFTINNNGQPGPLPTGYAFTTNAFLGKRPNPNFSTITDIFSGVTSNYEALVAQFTHRLSHSVSVNANYTWSHALDYGENNETGAGVNYLYDPTNIRLEYGNSNQNIPNRFVVYGVLDSPWHKSGPWGYLVNDFQISPDFQFQTGLPYSVGVNGYSSTLTVVPGQPVQTLTASGTLNGSGASTTPGTENRVPVFNRNAFQQPKTYVVDMRISKRLVVREHYSLEFLGEAFNLANHQNITGVNGSAYVVTENTTKSGSTTIGQGNTLTPYSTPFGQTTSTNNSNFAYSPRQLQLGVRLQF
jgi:hypothetical protein